MSFRLWTIFYAFAVVAVSLALFAGMGFIVAAAVLAFWQACRRPTMTPARVIAWVIAFTIFFSIVLLLLSSTPSVRHVARRYLCMSNEKEIALAILSYESANGSLPPAYVADASGKPMHSWRVLILPFMGPEEQALYRKYNFNEPWDGPNNSKLAAQIPGIYRCPNHDAQASPLETSYFAVVDPETAWPGSVGRKLPEISDGPENTILLVEASGLGINWMEPRDPSLAEAIELMTEKNGSGHRHMEKGLLTVTDRGGSARHVAFSDGHAHLVGRFKNPRSAKALLTVAGGETIPSDFHGEVHTDEPVVVAINWRSAYALSLFAIIAILPLPWYLRSKPRH